MPHIVEKTCQRKLLSHVCAIRSLSGTGIAGGGFQIFHSRQKKKSTTGVRGRGWGFHKRRNANCMSQVVYKASSANASLKTRSVMSIHSSTHTYTYTHNNLVTHTEVTHTHKILERHPTTSTTSGVPQCLRLVLSFPLPHPWQLPRWRDGRGGGRARKPAAPAGRPTPPHPSMPKTPPRKPFRKQKMVVEASRRAMVKAPRR